MIKYTSLFLCFAMTLCLWGCSKTPAPTTAPSTTPSSASSTEASTLPTQTGADASTVYDAHMASVSMPLIVETEKTEGDSIIAYYTHQDASIILPDADVAEQINLDLLNKIDKSRPAAEAVLEAAKADYKKQENWYPYSYAITYQPMRLDQNVLSFFGTESSFDGSPRSLQTGISITYDLTTGDPLSLRSILQEENYADVLCSLIIEGLKNAAIDSLFADYENIVHTKFSTNVPVDSWYFTNEGLCFYFSPYEIAAYAAGTVVAEIPYEKLSGLLKDQYFPGESLSYSGALLAQVLSDNDAAALEKFTQFAEVTVDPDAEQILISTNGSVSNIHMQYKSEDGACGVSQCTILTLAGMGPTDAILLTIDEAKLDGRISITFDSYGQTQILTLTKATDDSLSLAK